MTCPALQDVEWAEYDAKNRAVNDACANCFETLQRLDPEMSVETACACRESKDPQATSFWSDFQSGRLIRLGEENQPQFLPKSDVGSSTSYGMVVYSKVGLVTEQDLLRLTGATAKQLKGHVTPLSLKMDGPTSPSVVMYPISLRGLPADELASMVKGKMYYDLQTSHVESTLKAEDQLAQSQGTKLFSFSTAGLQTHRPMMKDHHKLMTIAALCDVWDKAKAQAAAEPNSAVAVADDSESEPEDGVLEEPQPKRRGAVGFSLGSIGSAKNPKNPKSKKGLPKQASKAKVAPGPGPSQPVKSPRDESPSVKSSVRPGKTSKADRLLDETKEMLHDDAEMLRVAKRHLGTKKGSSAKCLSYLKVSDILKGNKPPGNNITGAGIQNIGGLQCGCETMLDMMVIRCAHVS